MAKDEVFVKLDNYVKSANELAESVRRDLMNNEGILSEETLTALTDYGVAALAAANLLQIFDGTGEH